MSTGAGVSARRLHSVNDLLTRGAPALTRVTAHAGRVNFWNEWLSEHLAPELRPRISGVVERDGTLVIFAESAVWSARLRFVLPALELKIRAASAAVAAVEVRVRPR